MDNIFNKKFGIIILSVLLMVLQELIQKYFKLHMKAFINGIEDMDLEELFLVMGIIILDNGKMIKCMGLVNTYIIKQEKLK